MVYEFRLPIFIGKDSLNLNKYRNNHYQVNSRNKREFMPINAFLWEGKATVINVDYQVYKRTQRRYDTMNIVSIVDKYFLDWLVKCGHLVDDACDNVSYGKIEGFKGSKTDYVIAKVEVQEKEV